MEFRLGTEQRVCGPGDVMVNPGGSDEHEAWFHKDTELIDGAILERSYLRLEHFLWRPQFRRSGLAQGSRRKTGDYLCPIRENPAPPLRT